MALEIEKKSLTEEKENWLSNEFWPTPKWLEKDDIALKLKDYESYYRYNLRSKYLELEGDFRSAYGNFFNTPVVDMPTASRIVDYLGIARKALEDNKVNLMTVANMLDLIDRYLIWIYPEHLVKERTELRVHQYASLNPAAASEFEEKVSAQTGFGQLRAIYDEVSGEINRINEKNHISSGLQIKRLSILRFFGILFLGTAILAFPLIANFNGFPKEATFFSGISNVSSSDTTFPLINWACLLVFVIMGATGGFISGLLQIRNTRVDLIEFRESLLLFQLKPIVGGLTAAIITVLLSWQILPGIKIESIGSFLLIAFLSGFSERYFLKLLKIDNEGSPQPPEKKTEDTRDLKVSEKDSSELPNHKIGTQ